jgi:teichuronic acid exporter
VPSSLKKKSVSAALWSIADIVFRKVLQFVLIIALMRMLTPEAFGTMALIYIFLEFSAVLVESGFAAALIQRQDVTHADESTVFWFNVFIGTCLALAFWICSPLVAKVYGLPELEALTKIMGLTVFLNSLGTVHQTLLSKKLDFKPITLIGILSSAISATVAIFLAWQGYGVWALAAQVIVSSLIINTIIWILSDWRPLWVFKGDSIRKLFGFGSYIFLAGLVDLAYKGIFSFVIVKLFGVRDLGFFSRAENLKQLPVDMIIITLTRVAFPAFSATAADPFKLRLGMQGALRTVMFLNVPLMLGLIAAGENFVLVVFGDKWLPAVPLLQILALAGLLWPLHALNLNILKARGESRLYFHLEILKKLIGLAFIFIGARGGIEGLAWSQVAFTVVAFLINAHFTGKIINYGALGQVIDVFPVIVVGLIMAAIASSAGSLVSSDLIYVLSLQVLLGMLSYFFLCHFLKIKAYCDIRALLRGDR